MGGCICQKAVAKYFNAVVSEYYLTSRRIKISPFIEEERRNRFVIFIGKGIEPMKSCDAPPICGIYNIAAIKMF
jgi:hypothetical protein